MPRIIEVTMASSETPRLLKDLCTLKGVLSIALQHQTSVLPPGDVVTINATNEGSQVVLHRLTALGLVPRSTIVTSEPKSLIQVPNKETVEDEGNEALWDEMNSLLRRESNLSFNYLWLMFASGIIAAVGLWSDKLHLVVGAMVIAPGFIPILRISLGFVSGPLRLAWRGLVSSLLGYLALAGGAAGTAWVLPYISSDLPPLALQPWVQYWTTLSGNGVLLGMAGGAAGAVVVATLRSELTAGVMITLALIPAMGTMGMAIVLGDGQLAFRGLLRWSTDVGTILFAGTLVFLAKQHLVHRRSASL